MHAVAANENRLVSSSRLFKKPDFSPAQPWRAGTHLVPSRAAASEGPRRTLRGTLGCLNDVRTELADFFSSLQLVQLSSDSVGLEAASCR
jgi:hypothetical protein